MSQVSKINSRSLGATSPGAKTLSRKNLPRPEGLVFPMSKTFLAHWHQQSPRYPVPQNPSNICRRDRQNLSCILAERYQMSNFTDQNKTSDFQDRIYARRNALWATSRVGAAQNTIKILISCFAHRHVNTGRFFHMINWEKWQLESRAVLKH